MARIFSIHFLYHGLTCHALVSVRTTPFFSEYTISLMDKDLAELLPDNKIISTSKNSFSFSDASSENSPELMKSIIEAVKGHLQTLHA